MSLRNIRDMAQSSTKRGLKSTGRVKSTGSHTNQSKRSLKDSHSVGVAAELYVVEVMCDGGSTILERNYHCRFAEIDIIAIKDLSLYYIEVKCSEKRSSFPIIERVDARKINKIASCAEKWLSKNPEFCKYEQKILLYEITLAKGDFFVANIREVRV